MASGYFGDDINHILKSQLECPVCMLTCSRPIYLCANGHNVCGECQKTLTSCPVCRKDGRPSIRNLFAEEVSLNIWADCRNATQGCQESLKIKDMASHLEGCEFGYRCMFEDCDWHGSVANLAEHAANLHSSFYLDVGEAGIRIFVDGNEYDEEEDNLFLTAMLAYKEHFFWMQVEITDSTSFDAVVRQIGTDEQRNAAKLSYQLEFQSEGGRTKVTYNNTVRALADDGYSVGDTVFEDSFALTGFFSDSDLCFTLKMFDGKVASDVVPEVRGKMELVLFSPANWPKMKFRVDSGRRDYD